MSKTVNFSKDLEELEKIVDWFESGDVDLDQALERFEKGMELANKLKSYLEGVENRVVKIKQKFGQGSAKVAAIEDDSEEADDPLAPNLF